VLPTACLAAVTGQGPHKTSTVIPFYKAKGDIQDCNYYRGIKLLSHTMKLWERFIEGGLRKDV